MSRAFVALLRLAAVADADAARVTVRNVHPVTATIVDPEHAGWTTATGRGTTSR